MMRITEEVPILFAVGTPALNYAAFRDGSFLVRDKTGQVRLPPGEREMMAAKLAELDQLSRLTPTKETEPVTVAPGLDLHVFWDGVVIWRRREGAMGDTVEIETGDIGRVARAMRECSREKRNV